MPATTQAQVPAPWERAPLRMSRVHLKRPPRPTRQRLSSPMQEHDSNATRVATPAQAPRTRLDPGPESRTAAWAPGEHWAVRLVSMPIAFRAATPSHATLHEQAVGASRSARKEGASPTGRGAALRGGLQGPMMPMMQVQALQMQQAVSLATQQVVRRARPGRPTAPRLLLSPETTLPGPCWMGSRWE